MTECAEITSLLLSKLQITTFDHVLDEKQSLEIHPTEISKVVKSQIFISCADVRRRENVTDDLTCARPLSSSTKECFVLSRRADTTPHIPQKELTVSRKVDECKCKPLILTHTCTGAKAEAWCLLIHADASPSLSVSLTLALTLSHPIAFTQSPNGASLQQAH